MLKRYLSHGVASTLLLGITLALPAGAECPAHSTCVSNGATPVSPMPAISFDSSYYGFTAGIYGAINLPFKTDDVTDMDIKPALPSGLLFNSATGGITGTPTSPTAGVMTFVIRGTNDHGNTATTTVRIAVNPPQMSMTPEPSLEPAPEPSPSPSPSASPSASPSPETLSPDV